MKKKIIIITSIVIASIGLLLVVFGVIDFHRFKDGKTPIFPLHVFTNFFSGDGEKLKESNYKFHGVGYTITSCDRKNFKFHFGNVDIQCFDVDLKEEFIIVDETKICADALELIYEDGNYKYYFGCIKSNTVFIVFPDGTRMSVKEAQAISSVNWMKLITEKYPDMFYKEAKEHQYQDSVSCNKNDFEMNFYSDKKIYKTTEKIKAWSTLKYIGKEDNIKIYHASSYMLFSIIGKDFRMDPTVNSIATSSSLEKNKLYYFDFQKSGGWSADDPKADFWEKFYQEKDLLLPEGEYTLIAHGGFLITSHAGKGIGLKCELKIKVEK